MEEIEKLKKELAEAKRDSELLIQFIKSGFTLKEIKAPFSPESSRVITKWTSVKIERTAKPGIQASNSPREAIYFAMKEGE